MTVVIVMTLMRVMGEIREMKMITVHMCFENMTKLTKGFYVYYYGIDITIK